MKQNLDLLAQLEKLVEIAEAKGMSEDAVNYLRRPQSYNSQGNLDTIGDLRKCVAIAQEKGWDDAADLIRFKILVRWVDIQSV